MRGEGGAYLENLIKFLFFQDCVFKIDRDTMGFVGLDTPWPAGWIIVIALARKVVKGRESVRMGVSAVCGASSARKLTFHEKLAIFVALRTKLHLTTVLLQF